MEITQLTIELNENGESYPDFSRSPWAQHIKKNRKIIRVSRIFSGKDTEELSETTIDILKSYVANEEQCYQAFIQQLIKHFPEIIHHHNIDLPEEINRQFIENHISLIEIKLDEQKQKSILQFNFALSWNDKHRLIAVIDKAKLLNFSEDDYNWSYHLSSADADWSLSIDESNDEIDTEQAEAEQKLNEQNAFIESQELKLSQFSANLKNYKRLKAKRNVDHALSMSELLNVKTTQASDIDTKLNSCLFGETFGHYILIKGDLELKELDLDLLDSQSDIQGLIVEGNLCVLGTIYNFEGDCGPSLVVTGNTIADGLVGGGSEIHLLGKTTIHGFIIGHYNHGIIAVNGTTTLVEINDDHHSDVSGVVTYHFTSSAFSGEYFYTELAKIYGQDAWFTDQYEDEDDEIEYEFNTIGFAQELHENGDLPYLSSIQEHFEKRLTLYKSLMQASKVDDHGRVEALKKMLEPYAYNYAEPEDIGGYSNDDLIDNEYTDHDLDDNNTLDEDNDYSHLNLKMYDLSDLDTLNLEIKESHIFSQSKLSFLKMLFNKKRLSEFGLLHTKIDKMIGSTDFSEVSITSKKATSDAIDCFRSIILPVEKKRMLNVVIMLLFSITALWFYPNSVILYLFIAFNLFSLSKKTTSYRRTKQWLLKSADFVEQTTEKNAVVSSDNINDNNAIDDAIALTNFILKKDQDDWSVKVFDWAAKLVKGNKK